MKKYFGIWIFIAMLAAQLTGCRVDPFLEEEEQAIPHGNTGATPVKFNKPEQFPNPLLPADNPLTMEGIKLGRMLFYDPILSGDNTMSCGSCHKQELAFASSNKLDTGIRGRTGKRHSMPIFNLAWVNGGFFWDGRVATLEKQAVEPVKHEDEMDLQWSEAIKRLQSHSEYPELFKKAFGSSEVNQDNATKAIAQFMRTIISADSKFDRAVYKRNEVLTASERRGLELFSKDPTTDGIGNFTGGGSCDHCHGTPQLFIFQPLDAQNAYRNNGLDSAEKLGDFKDIGYAFAKPGTDNFGKFKVPSLRNVELTAPYMHDGRFKTLEDVIDHYNNGGHPSPTLDVEMARNRFADLGGKLHLTEQDKKDLIAFLKTLTDRTLITDKALSDPFK